MPRQNRGRTGHNRWHPPTDIRERLKTAAWWWLFQRGLPVHRGARTFLPRPPSPDRYVPADLASEWIDTIERVSPFTMTSPERLAALCSATEYVVRHDVPGSFVECGVWRGGRMMAVALTLQRIRRRDRGHYLFDTL